MRKSWILLCCCAAVLAACEKTPSTPQANPASTAQARPDASATPQQAASDTPGPASPRAPSAAGTLKSELPEGFQLPFAFHRLYDNTGKASNGKAQRRILVEFLGEEGSVVQTALTGALQAKGFSPPTSEVKAGITQLQFQRSDGATVEAKIDPKREKPRAPTAKGTVHLVWTVG